ncbi:MAG: hypothetical protein ACRDT4_19720 [Micromonosporaceae bacterium]
MIGARNAEQIQRNAALFAANVPDDLWGELSAEGPIPAGGT